MHRRVNPLLHSVPYMKRLAILFDSNSRRDHQKMSYERLNYESEDGKSISWAMSRETKKKTIQAV